MDDRYRFGRSAADPIFPQIGFGFAIQFLGEFDADDLPEGETRGRAEYAPLARPDVDECPVSVIGWEHSQNVVDCELRARSVLNATVTIAPFDIQGVKKDRSPVTSDIPAE
ncbi:MAG: hypothetical protein Kow0032_29420 [Methyloligellaceae bacterium]